jgi:hypothetical protein
LKAHVSLEIKLQAKTVADREFLSEAAWLKRLVLREIRDCDGGREREPYRADKSGRASTAARIANGHCKPVLVRLRGEDRLLMDARADARGMRSATYVAVLHLNKICVAIARELAGFVRAVAGQITVSA